MGNVEREPETEGWNEIDGRQRRRGSRNRNRRTVIMTMITRTTRKQIEPSKDNKNSRSGTLHKTKHQEVRKK